ncbi:MAG: prolyl oligopeptidase family serine peptidase [Planctomycetota bacterium]
MTNQPALLAELDARGWVGVAPDGRRWDVASQGCQWPYSPSYVDSPNPSAGPGEQDILDAIDFYQDAYGTDPDRVYLSGFSYGGRGAYIIGLKNPDRFAAIAPLGPAIDMYEIHVRRPENAACREIITGGEPGDSAFVDTMHTITSARFLIENAYNLPVFHGHGLLDTVTSNTLSNAPFLHGFHITTDPSWSGCHGATNLCFGHTPTLAELRARHPEGYDWAYCFTQIGHTVDPFWLQGGQPSSGALGTPASGNPSEIVGMFDFLGARTRVHSPDVVVYKTYTDVHASAYWLSVVSATAWQDLPAVVRAERDVAANSLSLEAWRSASIEIDVDRAGLSLAPGQTLQIAMAALVDPAYDPALASLPGESLEVTLVLRGTLGDSVWTDVEVDGQPLDPSLVEFVGDALALGPLPITAPLAIDVGGVAAFEDLGNALAGTQGAPMLAAAGATTPSSPVVFAVGDAMPNSIGMLVLGGEAVFTPLFGGVLVPRFDVAVGFALDGGGAAAIAATWPSTPAGSSLYLQAVALDPGAPFSVSASNALRCTTSW